MRVKLVNRTHARQLEKNLINFFKFFQVFFQVFQVFFSSFFSACDFKLFFLVQTPVGALTGMNAVATHVPIREVKIK